MLPRDLVRLGVNRGEGAGKRRAVCRLLRAGRVDLTAMVLSGKSFKHTRPDRPRHVEIIGIRAVGHWGPIGATLAGRLERRWLIPEGLEDAASLEAGFWLGAMRHGGVSARKR